MYILIVISCRNGGIYIYEGGECVDQYTGKTTVPTGTRFLEHLRRQKTSSVYKHRLSCRQCQGSVNFKCSIVEDYRGRGKYTLSEREYLWNYRIKGVINSQRTLLNWCGPLLFEHIIICIYFFNFLRLHNKLTTIYHRRNMFSNR